MVHKVIAPLSVAILQPIFLLVRLASPFYKDQMSARWGLNGSFFVAYSLGIAGLATAFTSITPALEGRDTVSNLHLKTGHGIAGLTFFICMHCLLPFLLIVSSRVKRAHHDIVDLPEDRGNPEHPVSSMSMEKTLPNSEIVRSASQSLYDTSPPASPRPRTNSWGPSSIFRRSPDGRMSTDSESSSVGPQRGFEVVNRPTRIRRTSGSWPQSQSAENSSHQPRTLGDIDWLQRRRTLNAVVSYTVDIWVILILLRGNLIMLYLRRIERNYCPPQQPRML